MSGPPPKPADKRQRRNKKTNIVPFRAVGKKRKVPPPPRGLLKQTEKLWKDYWNSQLAQVVEPDTDLPAITRLFTLYDERERAYRGFRMRRLIIGSQGQPVLNPLGRLMLQLDAEIHQLEDRLGLTPKSRLQLGITLGDAMRSLDDLNRKLMADDNEEEDPR